MFSTLVVLVGYAIRHTSLPEITIPNIRLSQSLINNTTSTPNKKSYNVHEYGMAFGDTLFGLSSKNLNAQLDDVKGLGTFVEVEAIDKEGSIGIEKLKEQCNYFLQLFDVKEEYQAMFKRFYGSRFRY